jgi:hypothetical protein|tara:strand:+ start:2344 stop:2847 length:504 start_codon:yes stop_codon:yes gene_type:complete
MRNSFKVVTLISLIPLLTAGPSTTSQRPRLNIAVATELEPLPIKQIITEPVVDDLIQALIQVESRGNDSAIGDRHLGEPSIGVLQLRPIMVREVNRILKKQKSDEKYKLKDRFSREKSIEMFMVWKNYHHPEGGFETIARNWNGGPRGYKNKRTQHYWAKVQLELNK